MNWTTEIPALSITLLDDGNLRLEDKSYSDDAIVDVHPIHLRLMAERLGLVREVSASDADMVRTIATLNRRLLLLQQRVKHLHEMLAITASAGREDLDYELTHCGATIDLLDEFCADLGGGEPAPAPLTPSHAGVTRDSAPNPVETHGKPSGNPAGSLGSAKQLALET